jgi:hypothetical protein
MTTKKNRSLSRAGDTDFEVLSPFIVVFHYAFLKYMTIIIFSLLPKYLLNQPPKESKVTVEWSALRLRDRDVPGFSYSPESALSVSMFCNFPKCLQANSKIIY